MRREQAWLLCGALLLASCGKTTDPLPDKNTNWLRACSSDSACGAELSCVCGLCTQPCTRAAQCGDDGEAVTCESTGGSSLRAQCMQAGTDDQGSICVATCGSDAKCEQYGDGWSCAGGICVAPRSLVSSDGPELDAGRSGTGTTAPPRTKPTGGSQAPEPEPVPDAMVDSGVDSGGGSIGDTPVEQPDVCGDGIVGPTEQCDGNIPFTHGICFGCTPFCEDGYVDCNQNKTDGCEHDARATPDLPDGPGNIPAGCVEVLASNTMGTSIAIDATQLYWTDYGTRDGIGNYQFDGKVIALPLAGGDPITLATDQNTPQNLVIADGYAYWINQANGGGPRDGAVRRVALTGGTPELVAGNLLGTNGLAVDDTYAYFFSVQDFSSGSSALLRAKKDGSAAAEPVLANSDGFGNTLLVADGKLYWKASGVVQMVASDGVGGAMTLSSSRDQFGLATNGDMLLDGDRLYWLFGLADQCGVATVPTAGEPGDLLANLDHFFAPSGLAVDAEYAYWGHEGDAPNRTTFIERSDKVPGQTRVLLQDPALGTPLVAVTDDALYIVIADWQTQSGMVLKMAK